MDDERTSEGPVLPGPHKSSEAPGGGAPGSEPEAPAVGAEVLGDRPDAAADDPGPDVEVKAGVETGPDATVSYSLPDWTDPPTLQIPRVLLDFDEQAGGTDRPPAGGPVWRESYRDWVDTDTVLADLASQGLGVTASETSSAGDPFAYDFLDADFDDPEPPAAIPPPLPGESSGEAVSVTSGASGGGIDSKAPGPASKTKPGLSSRVLARLRVASPEPPHEGDAVGSARNPAVESARNPVVATLTGLGLGLFALLCFYLGPVTAISLITVVVLLAVAELANALRQARYRPATLLLLVGAPGMLVAAYLAGPVAIVVGTGLFVIATMAWYALGVSRRYPVVNMAVTVFAFAWVGVLGAFAGLLLDPTVFPDRHGVAFLLGPVLAAVGYDVGGYAIGSRFGRHKLVPHLSPNKTWEGLIGGGAVAIITAGIVVSRIHPFSVGSALVLGVIVAVVAPIGDLAESFVKRDLGLKDMGSILPGHGGMLDRIDALLFVLPVAYAFVRLVHLR